MVNVYSKAIDKTLQTGRIIAKINGLEKGPTMVFFGGIHGNETSGVFAIKEVLNTIQPEHVKGTVYGIAGNLKALGLNQRYIDEDLNRLWTRKIIESLAYKEVLNAEERELLEVLNILDEVLKKCAPPFYFIDLHTTSSKTLPFITINDAIINRRFSKLFPLPIVLGIEEYLNGPLLSYINELGYVSLGFESGQHDNKSAINNSVAFIHLALRFANILKKTADLEVHYNYLKKQVGLTPDFFEVIYRHEVGTTDNFIMENGFESFQAIERGTILATNKDKKIYAKYSGFMFMPLYQEKGADGFFIIRPIKPFVLKLSVFLRRIKVDNLLVLLPGVSWMEKRKGVLKLNLKVARFFAKSLFHILGYRSKNITETHLKMNNRERVAKTKIYKNESWYK